MDNNEITETPTDLCDECHKNVTNNQCDVCLSDLCYSCAIDHKGQILCADCKEHQEDFENEDEEE